ncbi:glycosyltransferase family 9 protein [Aerosakkonemataceae cyanobacterium BLCC-F154]|uniref:Glycosyltransferase family 9 protein n=1 Tax=Floridaenema fluviatile BLCC-F154 TaxID=3153640 RepID=A0ABV4Y9T7_9CYAN
MDSIIWLISRIMTNDNKPPEKPKTIFILRNNDLGDLLVITPLFEALKKRFPEAYIVAGVGKWNVETLKLNPYISEILAVNAPWHNKFISHQGLWNAFNYIVFSAESEEIKNRHFDIGIDILGSYFGSLLMMRAGILYRLGVRGYAGGHTAVQKYVEFNEYEQVGRSALRFAELLGATELPECRPQIFLSDKERELGEYRWSSNLEELQRPKRVIIGPGGGFVEKCWPLENYVELMKLLYSIDNLAVMIVGGKQDREAGNQLSNDFTFVQNLAGDLTLRETFALVAAADLVVCNSSMLMHVAAAFAVPAVVLLGDYFPSSKQHFAQWGYPGLSHIFGKEGDRQEIYSPSEIIKIVRDLLY